MVRPHQFSEQQIIDAAFSLLAQKGPQAITARGVAQVLNASTAPIYSFFKNIEELYIKVLDHALSILMQYTEEEYTTDLFLNIGLGLLEFTKKYPLIYRTLFMDMNGQKDIFDHLAEKNLIQMSKEKSLLMFSTAQKKEILSKLTIYTHGLAALMCAGMLEDTSTDFFIQSLGDAGAAIIGYTAFRDNKADFFNQYGQSTIPPNQC